MKENGFCVTHFYIAMYFTVRIFIRFTVYASELPPAAAAAFLSSSRSLSSASASSLLASSLRNSIPTQTDRLVSALELQPVGVDELELPGGARARVRSWENSDSRVAWAAAVEIDGADDRMIQFCRQRRQVVEVAHEARRAGVA